MAIELPDKGATTTFWDFSYAEYSAMPKDSINQTPIRDILKDRRHHTYNYQKGVLIIHDGLHYHRINSQKHLKEQSDRVTLQGHGILIDGVWKLYF